MTELHHIVTAPQQASEGKPPAIIMLHGFGSHEQDLAEIGPLLDPRLMVISLRAPVDLTPMGMPGGYAWFPLFFPPGGGIEYDEAAALAALDSVETFVGAAADRFECDPQRMFMLGFSQGAMLVHGVVLRQTAPLAGAIACSGRMVTSLFDAGLDLESRSGFPLFVSHGAFDDVIPIANGRAIRDYYQQTPIDVSYREYPIGHGIDPNCLEHMRQWMAARLAEASSTA